MPHNLPSPHFVQPLYPRNSACPIPTINPYGNQTSAQAPPPGYPEIPCDTYKGVVYVIRPGDHCAQLSRSFGALVQKLISTNPFINKECTNLMPGTNVCIPEPKRTPAELMTPLPTVTPLPTETPTPTPAPEGEGEKTGETKPQETKADESKSQETKPPERRAILTTPLPDEPSHVTKAIRDAVPTAQVTAIQTAHYDDNVLMPISEDVLLGADQGWTKHKDSAPAAVVLLMLCGLLCYLLRHRRSRAASGDVLLR